MTEPLVLVALAGLPGAGKSTVADALGRRLGWPVLSVDPVEAAIRRAGVSVGQPTGLAAYVVVEAVAEHLLGLGQSMIVDAVNDAPEARGQWIDLAARRVATLRFIEVVCRDRELHRRRLSARDRGLGSDFEPAWDSLGPRRERLAEWDGVRLVLDSALDGQVNLDRAAAYVSAPMR